MSVIAPEDHLPPPQRRIRHITSLQVRNLTPFPARDALAQSLIQPVPSSSLLPQQSSDDIDLTISQRMRRISSGSIATVLNPEAEEEGSPNPILRKQGRSFSRGSFQGGRSAVSSSLPPTTRPKVRTPSKTSPIVRQGPAPNQAEDSVTLGEQDSIPYSGLFVTHSQMALEKIVTSRLVETFVTLTLLRSSAAPDPPLPAHPFSPPSSPPPSSPALRKTKDTPIKRAISASTINHRRGTSTSSSSSSNSLPHVTRSQLVARPASPATPRHRAAGNIRATGSTSRAANFPSPPPTPPPGSPRLKPPPSPNIPQDFRPSDVDLLSNIPPLETPFYISSIHLPSTNPKFFQIDAETEFAPWADTSGSRLKASVWGRKSEEPTQTMSSFGKDMKGKGKASTAQIITSSTDGDSTWRIIDDWCIDLEDMELFSPEKTTSHLASNTLLLTLSSGQTFCIPSISLRNANCVHPRVSTQVGPEYSSDSEVDGLRHRENVAIDAQKRHETLAKNLRETRMKKSATWQDLVKLVNLQAVISETRELLEEAVRSCDTLLESDTCEALCREYSEREEWITRLHSERDQVLDSSTQARRDIESRTESLALRRATLATAREHYKQDSAKLAMQRREIATEQRRCGGLVSSIQPLRTTLIQTASFIFPIEPLSAPDLLFSILGAPLPIPLSSSDPAPPLSLPSHPDVTEDTIATALGYVAQVIQLVSAYIGRSLVYPITCCGSKSICKDPISAMMGPRTFPLYSKGVETYRFEYAVFLLNKNIELVMADRNLRAMDMRHTLPNLKNLLLTLTTGEEIKHTRGPIPSIILGLSTRAVSPLALDVHAQSGAGSSESPTTRPPARKSSPFLSPLAAILRARYPSSIVRPAVKVVDEAPELSSEDEPLPADTVVANGNDLPSPQTTDCEVDKSRVVSEPNGLLPVQSHPEGDPLEKLTNGDCHPHAPPPFPGLS
ncbi:hypothetical protein BU17DRAFT_84116 [Hysterangium stoloniferum]|nr:hypothetical protein BU17DRAFT_84116 [Hysterangium stoloniferum]